MFNIFCGKPWPNPTDFVKKAEDPGECALDCRGKLDCDGRIELISYYYQSVPSKRMPATACLLTGHLRQRKEHKKALVASQQ